jgi:hypothetical protein
MYLCKPSKTMRPSHRAGIMTARFGRGPDGKFTPTTMQIHATIQVGTPFGEHSRVENALCLLKVWGARCLNWSIVTRAHAPRRLGPTRPWPVLPSPAAPPASAARKEASRAYHCPREGLDPSEPWSTFNV